MVTHSTFFFALYASIITVLLASRLRRLRTILEKCSDGIESLGEYFVPVVPFFMLAVGAYLFDLPSIIATHEISGTISTGLKQVTIFGYAISTGNAVGIVTVYVAGALLTGIACTVWHCVLMAIVKIRMRGNFSISGYLKNFWAKVYPLLWATSSESLAVPLMLHLMKVHYPKVREHIRRFVIGGGSFLNINGTLICVFVMAGVCTAILGYKLSFIQLMCALPIVFLIGYGVPGIPGELILFAGPMLTLLNMPDGLREMFLVLYLGLQIGLPDSFRTGSNSTDNCLMAVYIDRIYEDKFEKAAPQEIAEEKAA
jgi:Na+/H+-dicarboxylate symporter